MRELLQEPIEFLKLRAYRVREVLQELPVGELYIYRSCKEPSCERDPACMQEPVTEVLQEHDKSPARA
jgi:hypothetical protein